MRKAICILTSALAASAPIALTAQTGMDAAVETVLANNATLKAIRHETDAAKAEARAQSALPNPEVTFGYLWYDRKDVSVSQPLDWATLTGRRRAAANAADSLAETTYEAAEREITLKARLAYIGAVRGKALVNLLAARMSRSFDMADIARKRLAAGAGRQADVASTAAARAKALGELAKAQADLDMSMAELTALNGGERIDVADTSFANGPAIYGDFETWLASKGGTLAGEQVSLATTRQAQATARVSRAETMPQVAVGFMGEFTPADSYKGVTLGVSVPLWSARKRNRQTELTLRAAEQRHEATVAQARAEAEALFNKTLALGYVATELRESLETGDSRELFVKAVEQGEMSAAEAIVAEDVYYSAAVEAVEAEAAYKASLAELDSMVGR